MFLDPSGHHEVKLVGSDHIKVGYFRNVCIKIATSRCVTHTKRNSTVEDFQGIFERAQRTDGSLDFVVCKLPSIQVSYSEIVRQ